jgi:hypothetical protein
MENNRKILQNLDTYFLKLVAIISMVIDHTAKIFFPNDMALAIIGRIAFPLFAYCLVVGCLYTRNFKNYILRLSVFALISQPFYVMAFHHTWEGFVENILVANIFFTLVAGVLAVNALMNIKKNWWMLLIVVTMEIFIGLDYGFYGVGLMMLFYLFRNNNALSAITTTIWAAGGMGLGDFLYVGPIGLDLQFFAILALPLVYIHTKFNPKINKYLFYAFYPAHFMMLFVVRILLDIW